VLLWAKGPTAKDIHKVKFPVYGGKSLSRKAVHNWVEKFSQEPSKMADDARQGRSVETGTELTPQLVEELIQSDRRIKIDSVATSLGCSHGLAYSIMHGRLKFQKVCARWVPRQLKDQEKINLMGLSLQRLLQYAGEGEHMLNRTVTGDESLVHHYKPDSKCASVHWKHRSSHSAKKCKVTHQLGKLCLPCLGFSGNTVSPFSEP
jgi:hypothetical protein